MALTDIADIAEGTGPNEIKVRNQLKGAMVELATVIRAEPALQPDNPDQAAWRRYVERQAFARLVLTGPASYFTEFIWTVAQDTTLHGNRANVADSVIRTAAAAAVNALYPQP